MTPSRILCWNALIVKQRYANVLNNIRSSTGRLGRNSPQYQRPYVCAFRARYSTNARGDGDVAQGIVTWNRVAGVTIHKLASSIPKWKNGDLLRTGSRLQLVLLLSRGLAHLLNDSSSLVGQVIRQVFPVPGQDRGASEDGASTIEVFAAVVDQVPGRGVGESQAAKHDPEIDSASLAFEGAAYYITPEQIFQMPKALDPSNVTQRSRSVPDIALTSAEALPLLTFELHSPKRLEASMDLETAAAQPPNLLSLPLANTLFQTGKTSTAFYSRWTFTSGKATELLTVESKATRHVLQFSKQSSELHTHKAETIDQIRDHGISQMPLSYLTPLRKVGQCMGNVITKLHEGDDASEVPASRELEQSVSQFLEANDMPPQLVEVWALFIPKVRYNSINSSIANLQECLAKMNPTNQELLDSVAPLLFEGAQLRKVLSGGGGWGQKSGLLSVDPDDAFAAEEQPLKKGLDEPLLPSFLQPQGENPELEIKDVAKRGDLIVFFAGSVPPSHVTVSSETKGRQDTEQRILELGALPSTMDAIPEQASASDQYQAEDSASHYSNRFGALSEGGLSFQYEGVKTKLDIPGTRYICKDIVPVSHTVTADQTNEESSVAQRSRLPDAGHMLPSKTSDKSSQQHRERRLQDGGAARSVNPFEASGFTAFKMRAPFNPTKAHRGNEDVLVLKRLATQDTEHNSLFRVDGATPNAQSEDGYSQGRTVVGAQSKTPKPQDQSFSISRYLSKYDNAPISTPKIAKPGSTPELQVRTFPSEDKSKASKDSANVRIRVVRKISNTHKSEENLLQRINKLRRLRKSQMAHALSIAEGPGFWNEKEKKRERYLIAKNKYALLGSLLGSRVSRRKKNRRKLLPKISHKQLIRDRSRFQQFHKEFVAGRRLKTSTAGVWTALGLRRWRLFLRRSSRKQKKPSRSLFRKVHKDFPHGRPLEISTAEIQNPLGRQRWRVWFGEYIRRVHHLRKSSRIRGYKRRIRLERAKFEATQTKKYRELTRRIEQAQKSPRFDQRMSIDEEMQRILWRTEDTETAVSAESNGARRGDEGAVSGLKELQQLFDERAGPEGRENMAGAAIEAEQVQGQDEQAWVVRRKIRALQRQRFQNMLRERFTRPKMAENPPQPLDGGKGEEIDWDDILNSEQKRN